MSVSVADIPITRVTRAKFRDPNWIGWFGLAGIDGDAGGGTMAIEIETDPEGTGSWYTLITGYAGWTSGSGTPTAGAQVMFINSGIFEYWPAGNDGTAPRLQAFVELASATALGIVGSDRMFPPIYLGRPTPGNTGAIQFQRVNDGSNINFGCRVWGIQSKYPIVLQAGDLGGIQSI